jgi:hypothetical protein
VHRLIEPESLHDLLSRNRITRQLRSDQRVGEVSRGERREREDDDRDAEEDRDADQKPANDEGGH